MNAPSRQPLHLMVTVGTRPEATKLAPVVLAARDRPHDFRISLVATGQHREIMRRTLAVFGLTPDLDLDIMEQRQTLAQVTCRSLAGLDRIAGELNPDMVMVQGDTLAVVAGALAAYFHKMPTCHVEAGLRTGDPYDPFPEEMNRRLAARLCAVHCAPTEAARENLLAEGVPPDGIYVTGNSVTDAIQWVVREQATDDGPAMVDLGGCDADGLETLGRGLPLIVVTAHRRESIPEGLRSICEALRALAEGGVADIVFAVHPNPAVREVVVPILGGTDGVALVEPPDYAAFAALVARCHIVITDSGGLQEECPALGKPVLVVRQTTERPEGVDAGVARLVGTKTADIVGEATQLLRDPQRYAAMTGRPNPYGDGNAASRVLDAILHYFGRGPRPSDYEPTARA